MNKYTHTIINAVTGKDMTQEEIAKEEKIFHKYIVVPDLEKINSLFKEQSHVV